MAAEFFFCVAFPWLCCVLAQRGTSVGRLAAALLATVLGGALLYAAVIWVMNSVGQVAPQTQYLVTVYNPLLRGSEFVAGCVAGQLFMLMRDRGAARGRPATRSTSSSGRS